MRASLFALALLAAACTPSAEAPAAEEQAVAGTLEPATDDRQPAVPDPCGAAQYRALIGTNIAAATFPADSNIRIIRPMTPVTEDFRENRLNVIVDVNGVITSLECY
jgi:hypothetical protein